MKKKYAFFTTVLLHFHDLNYLNSTKSQLSNQMSNQKMYIVTKFQVSIFKNDEPIGRGRNFPNQHEISWLKGNVK